MRYDCESERGVIMAEPATSRNAGSAPAAPLAGGDESPIEIGVVAIDDVRYAATPPLRFEVAFDPRSGLNEVAGEFGILLSCSTRAELEDALNDTLAMLWREYAEEDPATLSPKAVALRSELRARFTLAQLIALDAI